MLPPRESDDTTFAQLCGVQFAAGAHRTVHNVINFPELVMKVARYSHFANWCEYLVSLSLEGRPTEVRVGNVKSISASGRFLLMERLDDLCHSLSGVTVPKWLNDKKTSAFGVSATGEIKIRDFGMLQLGDQLGTQQYVFEEDRIPVSKKVPNGADSDFARLMGPQIGVDGTRAVHQVIGEPVMALKVCNGSHKENALEWIIHSELAAIDAEELLHFPSFECSCTGKYILTDKLRALPAEYGDNSPAIPWWLPNSREALGVDTQLTAKFRRWADANFGEILVRAPVRRI